MDLPRARKIAIPYRLRSPHGIAEGIVDSLDVIVHRVLFHATHVPHLSSGSARDARVRRRLVRHVAVAPRSSGPEN